MQLFYLISSAMTIRLAYLQEPTFQIVFYHHERAFPIPHHGILYRVLWLPTNIFLYRLSSWHPPFVKFVFVAHLFSPPLRVWIFQQVRLLCNLFQPLLFFLRQLLVIQFKPLTDKRQSRLLRVAVLSGGFLGGLQDRRLGGFLFENGPADNRRSRRKTSPA